jgi:radical SAM protein with 4Fe4S-binding SPASM domain
MEYGFASDKHKEFPPMVVVSITNVCNQKCIHCHWPTFAAREDYVATEMPWEIWTKICDEMGEHPWSLLNLGTDGEPMTHRRFMDMLRYARKRKIKPINLTTNGILLTEERARTILSEQLLDVINISLDAFKEETYEKIRVSKMFKKVQANVHRLIELRDEMGAPAKIQVNIIDQLEVKDELADFVAYWEPRVDNVMVRTYYDSTHVTGKPGPNITGKQKEFEHVDRWPCQQFWRRLNVSEDGHIRYCVDDWYNGSKLGHLEHDTLKEVWQSEAYNKYRQIHLNRDFHTNPFCAECTEWQGMRWDYDYFTAMERMLGQKLV